MLLLALPDQQKTRDTSAPADEILSLAEISVRPNDLFGGAPG